MSDVCPDTWGVISSFSRNPLPFLLLNRDISKEVKHNIRENITIDIFFKMIFHNSVNWIRVLLLDKRVDPSVDDNWPIQLASENGHSEIVKLMLTDKRVDPFDHYNYAIQAASENGYTEIVKLLLKDKRVDQYAEHNLALLLASENGHTEIVKILENHLQARQK